MSILTKMYQNNEKLYYLNKISEMVFENNRDLLKRKIESVINA